MKTEIKIKALNNHFDLFIIIDGRVVHVEQFKAIDDIEQSADRLVSHAKSIHTQAKALEAKLNAMVQG